MFIDNDILFSVKGIFEGFFIIGFGGLRSEDVVCYRNCKVN